MSFVEHFFDERLTYALGWTIIHSFWQILLIALLLKAMLSVIDSGRSGVRYTLTGGAILLITLAAAVTFRMMSGAYLPESTSDAVAEITVMEKLSGHEAISEQVPLLTAITAALDRVDDVGLWIEMHLSAIVLLWMGGFIFFVLRFSVGVLYVQRLKHAGVKQPDPAWQQMAVRLSERLGLKKMVTVLESYVAKTPMVIGHFKPVILIPAGLLMGLTPEQAEAVLAHELAHIRRKDYLVNILKSILEVLFFYHPAIWWISSVFDREREHCCDDMTVKAGIGAGALSLALYRIAAFNATSPQLAMSFFKHKYQLLNRIKRMNNRTNKVDQTGVRSVAITVLLLAVAIVAASSSMPGSAKSNSFSSINIGPAPKTNDPVRFVATPDSIAEEEFHQMEMQLKTLYRQNQMLQKQLAEASAMHTQQSMELNMQMKENYRHVRDAEKQLEILRKQIQLAQESGELSKEEQKQLEKEIKLEHLRLEEVLEQLQKTEAAYEAEIDVQQDQLQEEFERVEKEMAVREMELEQKHDELLQKEKELKKQMVITEKISNQLLSDGLVQKGMETRVRLTDDALFINGEKQKEKYHKKYMKMYQDLSGQKFAGDLGFNFNIK